MGTEFQPGAGTHLFHPPTQNAVLVVSVLKGDSQLVPWLTVIIPSGSLRGQHGYLGLDQDWNVRGHK